MKSLTAILALGWVLSAPAVEAQQQRSCGQRDPIVERLAEKYGESRQSIGLGADNSLLEVYASPDTGSWTILVTYASGLSCLMATGQNFETMAETLPTKSEKDA
ncbi:hypothetical protein R3X27_21145 [Tropicimonas sp. TH_r6]|uniref:hypothetical protein n=1 Tax=Tropicimonas sp. TH_r6 TaxID=3082085 RepID=UPI0029543D43|nr:hypothetical protein [Tropicimonas sp. TH_r6]MDV7145197.1 hypothetical protein [Tropicimonas sp. TH_r6]